MEFLRPKPSPSLQDIKVYGSLVNAGFPSPADDYLESRLDLNELLIKHPTASFFIRVNGDSMIGAGIFHNDLVLIDRSLMVRNGDIVLAVINEEFTLKRYRKQGGRVVLYSDNPSYKAIPILSDQDFLVWGIATYVIHGLRR